MFDLWTSFVPNLFPIYVPLYTTAFDQRTDIVLDNEQYV